MVKQRTKILLSCLLVVGGMFSGSAQDAAPEPETTQGIKLILQVGGARDVSVRPNVLLYVPAGEAPSPFVPQGGFTAVFEGFVSVDLRDRYTFRAELNGSVKVELEDKVILEQVVENGITEESRRARLSKGLNPIRITYTGPEKGDAYLRLQWSSPDFSYEPVGEGALLHAKADPEVSRGLTLRKGRQLFAEHRCFQCHVGTGEGMPELAMDAPSFEGIGSRRNTAWMARWIQSPDGARSIASMPALLHGPQAGKDAADIAAFLGTLSGEDSSGDGGGDAGKGKALFTNLHCEACHNPPGGKADEARLSLTHVKQKFSAGSLATFLSKPEAHYAWIRMPNFGLKKQEVDNLAAYLLENAPDSLPAIKGDAGRGRKLVATLGCVSCHQGPVENEFKGLPIAKLAGPALEKGCLADEPSGKAPRYSLENEERAAIRIFLAEAMDSLKRSSHAEFAARQTELLNCTKCHGQYDGFPVLGILGGKLRPEWSESFIAGHVDYKPRPWIAGRMPAFESRAKGLAQGMAMLHGMPPVSAKRESVEPDVAAIGRKMIGTDGGFSCIACHPVGTFGATQVFESAGINFAYSGERLTKPFFDRWLLNPLRIDPQTKMPVYFPGGQSMLYDYYDGDALKQINAFWEYVRQGKDIPLPHEAQ